MRRLAALALALTVTPTDAGAQTATLPDWMAGCWEMRDGDRWTEECWTTPRGGQMMGSGRTGSGDNVRSFEHMRIERGAGGALTFVASPRGQGWTAFASAPDPGAGVTFVNAANDYPQRIRYWREGDLLKAETSLRDGSNAVNWTFRRMGG